MRFTPKSDEELTNVFDGGDYAAVIENAEETQSKARNDMLVLTVRAYHTDGRTKVITDYITEASGMKLKRLCQAVGLGEAYDAGDVQPRDLWNKSVSVKLKIELDRNGEYPPKNVISTYLPLQQAKTPATPKPVAQPRQQQAAQPARAASQPSIAPTQPQGDGDDVPF